MQINIKEIIVQLERKYIINNIYDIIIDEILERAVYKFKCKLNYQELNVDVRFILSYENLTYSYQLYSTKPLLRWDNAPHYPKIKTYPHHFHDDKNNVLESNLTGDIYKDINAVFGTIENYIKQN